MAVYKPSNFYPNLQEIDLTKENEFSCQINTSGENIQAYKIQILSSDGSEKIAETDTINLNPSIKNKKFLKTNVINSSLSQKLVNGKNYQWGIRTYNAKKGTTQQPNTLVCSGFLVGSTKYVIWSNNNKEIVEDRYLEIETTGPEQIFDIIGKNEEGIKKPESGEKYRERHKIEWVTKDLGFDKNFSKLELDESFKYNYKDGTPFKIFKCSDNHGLNNFYVEPNDSIKSSNYIIIYNNKEDAERASKAGDTPDKTTVTPRETGRKIIGYSVDTGEIRVQESFKEIPQNGNAYLLFEKNNLDNTYKEKKFTEVSNVIGGVAINSEDFKIITNKIQGNDCQLFIQPNINIKTDDFNPNEIVFDNGVRIDIVKQTKEINSEKVDVTFDKLDNTQWLIKPKLQTGQIIPIIPKTNYSVFTDFMDSFPYSIFYARKEPMPIMMYKSMNEKGSNFEVISKEQIKHYRDISFKTIWFTNDGNIGDYDINYPNAKNTDNINVKFYQYFLYDSDGFLISKSSELYDSELEWSYRGFESGVNKKEPNIYIIKIRIIDEYGKEYEKEEYFNIFYETSPGLTPLLVDFNCKEKAISIQANAPSYAASVDYEDKKTVNNSNLGENQDYVTIKKGEVLNYTKVVDNKEPPTAIIIPKEYSFITQFQLTGDFLDNFSVDELTHKQIEQEIFNIRYKTNSLEENSIEQYSNLSLRINGFDSYYYSPESQAFIKNENQLKIQLYKDDQITPLKCFNGKDYYSILEEDTQNRFKVPTTLKFALQNSTDYWFYPDKDGIYDELGRLLMPRYQKEGKKFLVLTEKAYGVNGEEIPYDAGIYYYDVKQQIYNWIGKTDAEYVYIDNFNQLPEDLQDSPTFAPENCVSPEKELLWSENENNIVWVDTHEFLNDTNKKVLNTTWFLLYLIVTHDERNEEVIKCDIKMKRKRG